MNHTKENCLAHHLIIASCCGLGCANCGTCKCTPAIDPCTREGCAGEFLPLSRLEDGITDAKQCDACRLLVGIDY